MITEQNDWIRLHNLQFHACHGVLEWERTVKQAFTVTVALQVDLRTAGQTDHLDDTINYAQVVDVIAEIMAGPPLHLLEALAHQISQTLIGLDGRIAQVIVKVCKVHPPVAVGSGPAEVEIHRYA